MTGFCNLMSWLFFVVPVRRKGIMRMEWKCEAELDEAF